MSERSLSEMLGEAEENGDITPEDEIAAHDAIEKGGDAEATLREELEEQGLTDEEIEEELKKANLK